MGNPFSARAGSKQPEGDSRIGAGGFIRDLELDLKERAEFLRAFIKEPAHIGAVSPSSRSLARAMIHEMALQTADTVVEIGPGTGAFTSLILKRVGETTTFFALELNSLYAGSLKRRFPNLIVYNDSAERMRHYLAQHRKKAAKYIISGLPWATIDPAVQGRIMDAVLASLAPDGVFTTFAYVHALWMPAAQKFRRKLAACFARVEMSPIVWKNLPPAFVYRCSPAQPRIGMEQ